MVMQPDHTEHWSVKDYFALEEESEIKHEYIDGEIYAMSGRTATHSKIIFNLGGLLFAQLRNSSCGGYESNLQIKISETRYVYPDFIVVCGQPNFASENQIMLTNPTMLVEVISESSERHDRFIKLDLYRSIPSLQIYLLIEQNSARATLYTRHQDGGWLLRDYIGLNAIVPLDAINATLALSELYETISFDNNSSS